MGEALTRRDLDHLEAGMDKNHEKGTTRRDLLKLGAASAVAGVAGSLPFAFSSVQAAAQTAHGGTRFLLDCHVHVGGSPALAALIDQVQTPKDWLALRGKQPEAFAKAASQSQVDNSDDLIAAMDKHGVTHALIQPTPGKDASNQLVANAAKRHEGRLFPIYRPEELLGDLGTGTMQKPDQKLLRENAQNTAEIIEREFPELGMVGMGEFIVGGFVTTALDPVEIARDLGPIMEALRPGKLPIQFPTATSGWKGGLFYIYEPLWVDELAGNFPDVPIVLTKMGRGIPTSFDACLVVAKRNANVYFDLTDSRAEHLREAIDEIGAHRIMFGTDLHGLSVNYAIDVGFEIVDGARPSKEEREWIAWRTANEVYQLGLAG
jgi:predicted TIM-barrel fold metal-dependent hydrolase